VFSTLIDLRSFAILIHHTLCSGNEDLTESLRVRYYVKDAIGTKFNFKKANIQRKLMTLPAKDRSINRASAGFVKDLPLFIFFAGWSTISTLLH
jgi:hypothetical protein